VREVVKSRRKWSDLTLPDWKGGVILPEKKESIRLRSQDVEQEPQPRKLALPNMPHRASSPAASENEFDITNSLFKDDVDAGDNGFRFPTSKDLGKLDAGGILDLANESDGDGDDAFIAAQQAASNRKASNVKGKSVKKGGGFQAMGKEAPRFQSQKY
jgi:hypothetical protein